MLCETLEPRWSACRANQCIRLCQVLGHPCALCGVIGCMRMSDGQARCDNQPEQEIDGDRWPCTSPKRNHCRAGTTGKLSRGLLGVLVDFHWCQAPLAGVRASDWLKELES